MTKADDPDTFDRRWGLEVRARAQRQLSRLPEKVATAVAEFVTGPLLGNPLRVGHPLRDEYDGQFRRLDARPCLEVQATDFGVRLVEIKHVLPDGSQRLPYLR